MMAITAYFDLETHQFDFFNAFINAQLDEQVYCKLPDGFKYAGKLWRLKRALYGLRRSPLLWYKNLVTFLQIKGFKLVLEHPCVMHNGKILVFFYVDDSWSCIGKYTPHTLSPSRKS